MGPRTMGLVFALKASGFADCKFYFTLCPAFCIFVPGEANKFHDQKVICGPFT